MLKKLDDFNSERSGEHNRVAASCKNGIACPSCGAELFDTSPLVVLTSSPAQKHIHCNGCSYKGYRIA